MLGNMMESSVQVPASIFEQLQETGNYKKHGVRHVIVTMFKNNKLFPVGEDGQYVRDVISPVVGVRLGKLSYSLMHIPLLYTIRYKLFMSESVDQRDRIQMVNQCRL